MREGAERRNKHMHAAHMHMLPINGTPGIIQMQVFNHTPRRVAEESPQGKHENAAECEGSGGVNTAGYQSDCTRKQKMCDVVRE